MNGIGIEHLSFAAVALPAAHHGAVRDGTVRGARVLLALALLLLVAACGGGGGSGGDDDSNNGPGQPAEIRTLSITGLFLEEGSSGGTTDMRFTVTLDEPSASDVTVDYTTLDITTEAPDFVSNSGSVTIAAGDTGAEISIGVVADTAFELNEDFTVVLSNPSPNAVIGSGEALGRIINDDPLTIVFDLLNIGFFELAGQGKATRFELEYLILDLPLDLGDLLLDYDIYFQADELHVPWLVASGRLTVTAGAGTAAGKVVFEVPPGLGGFGVGGNFLIEFDWSALAGVSIPIQTQFITVPVEPQDVEPGSPFISIADVSVNEGVAGTTTDMVFVLLLDQAVATPVVVRYLTADATASAPRDYVSASGTVTIPANQTSAEFTVTVNGDDEVEGLESLLVGLSVESGPAILLGTRAVGFIANDDVAQDFRRMTVPSAELTEGDAGTASMQFELTLDQPALTPVTFSFATRDDIGGSASAESGSDYEATSGTRTFQPGESRLTIEVAVFGDTDPEDDETFVLAVTDTSANSAIPTAGIGTIRSDDPLARVSIASVALAEGDNGGTTFAFTVTLSEALNAPLEVDFATADITATAGVDYTAVNGSLTIPAGDTGATIEVSVAGDSEPEDDEVFQVVLSTTSASVILLAAIAEGTILNDDGDGGWAGAEVVDGIATQSVWPRAGFGPGGERHVIYQQNTSLSHRVSAVPGVWEAPAEIARLQSLVGANLRLAVDAAGRALATWTEDIARASSYLAGVGWQDLPLPQDVEAGTVELAGDPASGEAIAIWQEPFASNPASFDSIWAARFVPGVGWQDMGLVETFDDRHANNPSVALAANGTAIAVFSLRQATPAGLTDAVAYRLVGSSWDGPTVLDNVDNDFASTPKIDINADGDAAVTWYQKEDGQPGIARSSIYVARYDAANDQWLGAELVDDITTHSTRDPDVAIDGAGNVFVVWLQQSPDFRTWSLMANRYDVGTDEWSGPRLLEFDDTATGLNPILSQQVIADDLGNAIVVWIQHDGVLQNLRTARWSAADIDWQPPSLLEELDTGDANGPHLVIDRASGDAIVVWHHNDGSVVNIWANRYRN